MNGTAAPRSITTLIAALGGEGGGVLANWLVHAAKGAGLPVQATSIPGVAQRTGATTYYVEMWPQPWSELNGRQPVLALAPAPGEIDLMAATELMEAGRAVGGGFVTPDTTTLLASTHRMFTTGEKLAMEDGRYDPERLEAGVRERAQRAILFDMGQVAKEKGVAINSVLLGAIAATGILPLGEQALRDGVSAEGKSVAANLRGFEAGLAAARQAMGANGAGGGEPRLPLEESPWRERIEAEFPAGLHGILSIAVKRVADYQDRKYAELYLKRLAPFREAPLPLLEAVAKQLALRMAYEDAIRVAQAKTRPERLERVRGQAGAVGKEPVVITEFLMPGLEEICDILPEPLAHLVYGVARVFRRLANARKGMYVRTNTVWGFAQLRILTLLRFWRRTTWRYRREQPAIEAWLALVSQAAEKDAGLATEIAECARLIKGYGDTHKRGSENFRRIEAALIRPALEKGNGWGAAAEAIARAREAAVADPEGEALAGVIGAPPASPQAAAGK